MVFYHDLIALPFSTRKLCYRKDDRAMRPIYECLISLHGVGLVKLNSVFPTPPLVSPKFPYVPLGIGGWPLGYEKRRQLSMQLVSKVFM